MLKFALLVKLRLLSQWGDLRYRCRSAFFRNMTGLKKLLLRTVESTWQRSSLPLIMGSRVFTFLECVTFVVIVPQLNVTLSLLTAAS